MQMGRMMLGVQGGPGTPDPSHITLTNMSLSDLIQYAWDVKSYQVQIPGSLDSARFDIAAKLPAGATKADARIMVRKLLTERFQLALRHSSKEASIYGLMVAKGGPRFKASAPQQPGDAAPAPGDSPLSLAPGQQPTVGKDGFPQLPRGAGRRGGVIMMMAPGGRMRMISNAVTIEKFIEALSMQLDRPLVDMTGLTGTYDITLDFAPDPAIMQARMAAIGGAAPPGMAPESRETAIAPDSVNTASIFTALPDQLGLRLESRKGPVDLLIVDSARKTPTEN